MEFGVFLDSCRQIVTQEGLHDQFFSEKLSFFFSGKCRQFSKKRQFFSGLCMGISGPRYATLVKEGSPHFHIRSPKYSISHRARCRCMAYGELIFLVLSSFHPSNKREEALAGKTCSGRWGLCRGANLRPLEVFNARARLAAPAGPAHA